MTKRHYEDFGKYCTACNARCGPQSKHIPKRPPNPAIDELYLELYGKTEKQMLMDTAMEYRQLVLEMTTYPNKEVGVV